MITLAINDKQKVLQAMQDGSIYAANISFPTVIDDILLHMDKREISKDLKGANKHKRTTNKTISLTTILYI